MTVHVAKSAALPHRLNTDLVRWTSAYRHKQWKSDYDDGGVAPSVGKLAHSFEKVDDRRPFYRGAGAADFDL